MPSVHFRSVSFRYSSAVDVLSDASFDLGPGWAGVVGANGSGKSTLLRLVAGELQPDVGEVVVDPPGPAPALCPQEVGDVDEPVAALAAATDGVSRRISGQLALDPADLRRWPTLSPGERKRWQIGAALAREPQVLLLDEPTNHLDAEARDLLTGALSRFGGVGLVVSHDRAFLDALTDRTIRIEHGRVEIWNGSYEAARAGWEAAAQEQAAAYQSARAEQRKLRRRLADQRRATETKRARHKRSVREAGVKDPDARSLERKGRHEAGETTAARRLQVTQAAAERAAARAAAFEMRREIGRAFFFDYEPARRRRLLAYQGPLRAGAHLVAGDVDVTVHREDRIWLRGPNGAGKTTLLTALAGASTLPPERLLHLPQELTREASADLLAEVGRLPGDERGRVFNLVAALGVDPDRLLASGLPSPGEARKLAMATAMGRGAWCLLLDEPTNHLDLPSIERLEEAVAGYPGAVIVVTHDDDFAAATTTSAWHLDGGRLTEKPAQS